LPKEEREKNMMKIWQMKIVMNGKGRNEKKKEKSLA